MRYLLCHAGLVAGLVLIAPTLAAPPAEKPAKDKDEADAKLKKALTLTGKLVSAPQGTQNYFTIQVTLRYLAPNAGKIQEAANLQQQIVQTKLSNMKVADKINALADLNRRLQAALAAAYTVKEDSKNIDLKPDDDMKVRVMNLPPEFDEKGKPRKRTQAELKKLKGDPKLPGYEADLESLHADQIVTVSIVRKKPAADKGGLKDDEALADKRLLVSMIVVKAEPPPKP
jgi:hypothetical protein